MKSSKLSRNLSRSADSLDEYNKCVWDLLEHEAVRSMEKFIQHGNVSCLDHSIAVSRISYRLCKKLGLDYRSAARGGLLHDFFLYDWHITKTQGGLHGFTHPVTALRNAKNHYSLNPVEEDIIIKHMWPLTVRAPRYKESLVVSLVDKYCSAAEIFTFERLIRMIMTFRIAANQ